MAIIQLLKKIFNNYLLKLGLFHIYIHRLELSTYKWTELAWNDLCK